jgi:hypothetical protein
MTDSPLYLFVLFRFLVDGMVLSTLGRVSYIPQPTASNANLIKKKTQRQARNNA